MFHIRRSFCSHQGIKKFISLPALLSLLLLGAYAGAGAQAPTTQARAQGITFPLFSVVATTTGVNLRDQPSAAGAGVTVMPVNARAIVIGGPFHARWDRAARDRAPGRRSG